MTEGLGNVRKWAVVGILAPGGPRHAARRCDGSDPLATVVYGLTRSRSSLVAHS